MSRQAQVIHPINRRHHNDIREGELIAHQPGPALNCLVHAIAGFTKLAQGAVDLENPFGEPIRSKS
jgi:hypothetical protein